MRGSLGKYTLEGEGWVKVSMQKNAAVLENPFKTLACALGTYSRYIKTIKHYGYKKS